jgi:hypothetical protein
MGVAVEDAAQVFVGDELRELAFQSELDLPAPLPKFRVD